MLTTPGIDVETGEYEEFGIPATILANYLRDHRVVPEKNDLNSILFFNFLNYLIFKFYIFFCLFN